MQSLYQHLYDGGLTYLLHIQGRTLPYMRKRVAFPGHLNLVCSHLELENHVEASLIQMGFACLAGQPALELPVMGVVTAEWVSGVTVELVEKIGAADFE